MKKHILLLALALHGLFAFSQTNFSTVGRQGSAGKVITPVDKQALYDDMMSVFHYWHGIETGADTEGGMYSNTTLTTKSVHNGEVRALRAGGTNKPSPSNLIYKGITTLTPANALIWWKDNNATMYPTKVDFTGDLSGRGLRLLNAALNTAYFETDPGSFTSKTAPLDLVYSFLWLPDIQDEGFSGIKSIANNHIEFIDGYSPDIVLSSTDPSKYNYKPYVENWVYLSIEASGNWKVWLNVVPDATRSNYTQQGSGITWTTTEWWWGTNSHVLSSIMHYMGAKFGQFTSAEIDKIVTNTQAIWPWGSKPSYPLLTEMYYADASTFNSTTKAWMQGRGKNPVFSGGNGVRGTDKQMWYYFDTADATLFPSGDGVLTNIRQVPGSVNITTMASGNLLSQITVDGFSIMSGSVSFTTNVATTADAVVSNINAAQTKYFAQHRASSGVILLHPIGTGCNLYSAGDITPVGSGFTPTEIDYPRGLELFRTTFSGAGQIFNGVTGTSQIKIKGIRYPVDSNGLVGEGCTSGIIPDNIP